MKIKSDSQTSAGKTSEYAPAVTRSRGSQQLRVRTNIKAGREPTKHPAKVTTPDLK
jgi:hypothetical protein